MAQLTLRTLLAYIDDTLEPALARQLGAKVAESELAQRLIERIKKVTRRRGLHTPIPSADDDGVSDPNTVAEYLSNTLDSEQVTLLEETCLESDVHLAEVAACHQILTLLLTEPVRVPPQARQRMYKLVPPPASVPDRRPGKTLPVGGVAPVAAERAEPDDADAPLLLGLGRYTSGSVVGRGGLVAAVAALAVCLVIAVLMAFPHRPPEPPETDRQGLYAAAIAPPLPPAPVTPTPPAAKTGTEPGAIPAPKEKDSGAKAAAPPPKPKAGGVDLVGKVPPPRMDRVAVGSAETLNVILLTRPDDAPTWLRLDPGDQSEVTSADQVLSLPGYSSDVQLKSGVKVTLWGNVPELLPARLLESRVRFHAPERKADGKGPDIDADLTLMTGRIYLKATRPGGARVRVRFAGQVWDIILPDPRAEVLVEVVRGFDPGTPFARDGGQPPRVEAQVAVLTGTASLTPHGRFKTFDKIAAPAVVTWDSKTGKLADPKPIEPGNGYYDKFLTGVVGPEQGKAIRGGLSQLVKRLDEKMRRDGARVMLTEVLTEPPDPAMIAAAQMAVYGYAAIVNGPAAGDELKLLIDLLTDEARGYLRLAAVPALAAWIAQDPKNTALLNEQLAAKLRREGEPETILRLLRGYVNPAKPDPAGLDRLVGYLNDPSVAVRELALWNLVNFVDPMAAAQTPGLVTDVAIPSGAAYEKFVRAWKARVDEVKKGPPPKPPEKPPEKSPAKPPEKK